MKKPLKITIWALGILLAIIATLVFFILPSYFASSEEEFKEIENMNVDSLMNADVPEAPEVP